MRASRTMRSLTGAGALAALALALAMPGTPARGEMEKPGERYHIRADELPEPYATESVANSVDTVARPEGHVPLAPEGFSAELAADGLAHARNLIGAPDGSVYLAQPRKGEVTHLVDADGDGAFERRRAVAQGMARPHGLALRDGALHIGDLAAVWRAPLREGGDLGPLEQLTPDGALGGRGGHWTRNVAISPDGGGLYVSIGSRGNIAEEPEPRATIQRFDRAPDGTLSNQRTYAAGLRNPVGIAFHPQTGELYTVVNERDGMGDGLVPDYLTAVEEGAFYGWPYAYADGKPMPGYAERRPDLVEATVTPDVFIESHSAPLGLAFLADADVPPAWKDDALVALHGSWNAADPTGYKVVRVVFEDGAPTGEYVNFLTGFRLDDPAKGADGPAVVWGRPMGVAVTPAGDILISDDTGGTIWRVARE